ncbi:MAG: NAD(P)/FAD-dependent oxidoreductase [Methanocorpusculum sp.]|nr:NAD(P)/FAD-dependent oxidoreductase [Methanocorpusculum sp.]
MFDAVIIGGGPTGSTAARAAAAAGLSVLVLEEHAAIGYPVQCAGILSNSAFAECEVSRRSVYCTVSGAKIFGSDGHELSFDAGTTKAHIVDRGKLDHEMAERAAEAGAVFSLKTCVTSLNPAKKIIHTAGGTDIPYSVVIAADGPRSVAARSLGIPPSRFIYSGIQAEILYESTTPQVQLYPNAAPEFFAWLAPLSPTRARIGLCGTKNVPELFAAFTRKFSPVNVHSVTGTIPLGIRKKTWGAGCMLAGDAAGFPKPTSGGGVYTGIRSARHAAAVAIEAAEAGAASDAILSRYESLWKEDFGRELEMGLKALKFRRTFTAADIDAAIDALNTPEIIAAITQYGDMDRPSVLLKKLMKMPDAVSAAGKLGVKGLLRIAFG